jgi:maleylacetate reductase
VIVRWGLVALAEVCAEAGVTAPLLVASPRWNLPIDAPARWNEVPSERVDEAATQAGGGVIAVGGGSAIDLGKAISAAADVPLVSVPTTYSGAEWTTFYGIRDPERRMRGGGAGANPAGIVYDPKLTLDLPRATTVGTAMNALAHCAEALYVQGRDASADRVALEGADLISEALPQVLADPGARGPRDTLLLGAARGGEALGRSGLALGHAMAQAIGGAYGLPHGALNAICLPPALRFNEEFVPPELLDGKAADRAEELARLAGFTSLGALGVPEEDLPALAAATAQRPGALANPRPATTGDVLELLRSAY